MVTISNSSTVAAALQAASPAAIYALGSLPGGEGRVLAKKLVATLVPDAAMGRVVPSIDCAVVGIDAYDRSSAVVHKVLTGPNFDRTSPEVTAIITEQGRLS